VAHPADTALMQINPKALERVARGDRRGRRTPVPGNRRTGVGFHSLYWAFLFSCLMIDHGEQICRCFFDFRVFGLASAALCGEDATAMDIFEISIGKFVAPLTVFRVFIIYSQEPLAVFEKAILFDEFFLGLRGGMVIAPRVSLVVHKVTLLYNSLGVFICVLVQLHCHAVYLFTELRLENRQPLPH
jgi:hypothetical protein